MLEIRLKQDFLKAAAGMIRRMGYLSDDKRALDAVGKTTNWIICGFSLST